MALVDYSDSDSDSEVSQKPAAAPSNTATGKKPFQKLVDRGSGKIVVNLATTASADASNANDEPPAKRARTAASGSSRFTNFGSFLPPPKKTTPVLGKSVPASTPRSGGTAPAPGVHLKTGAEPAFSRSAEITEETEGDEYTNDGGSGSSPSFGSGLSLPPPKGSSSSGPTIPAGQKPADEVKLVGKPLMFKPLSVARKPGQQKKKKDVPKAVPPPSAEAVASKPPTNATVEPAPPPKKKVSLFSFGGDDEATSSAGVAETTNTSDAAYEPLFTGIPEAADTGAPINGEGGEYYDNSYDAYTNQSSVSSNHAEQQNTLSSIADSLSLSKANRRDLFGRNGAPSASNNARIINFSMEKEYAHNEALRQSGALADQVHNPVRSIAPGKHSLRQMVNMAQNNQAALEDSFAAGKHNRRDAAGKYGWK